MDVRPSRRVTEPETIEDVTVPLPAATYNRRAD